MLANEAIEALAEDGPLAVSLDRAGTAPLFSPVELLVIGIGERDPPVLLDPRGRLARLNRVLFGIQAPAPFADRRLEALRALAGALRQGRPGPDGIVAAALAAGITSQQLEHLKARNNR